MTLTENQKQWLNDLYDNEIKESLGSVSNEHIWAIGSNTAEEATQHENNCEELKQYVEILKELKQNLEIVCINNSFL